jgi:hypothetical protein
MAYNIFRKTSDTPLAWVEAAGNLDEAKKRLISLASGEPGDYFIWDAVGSDTNLSSHFPSQPSYHFKISRTLLD